MIYGKIWWVVKPTVGIPLFLGAVAMSSFLVHYMLNTHRGCPSTTKAAWRNGVDRGAGRTAAAPPTTLWRRRRPE